MLESRWGFVGERETRTREKESPRESLVDDEDKTPPRNDEPQNTTAPIRRILVRLFGLSPPPFLLLDPSKTYSSRFLNQLESRFLPPFRSKGEETKRAREREKSKRGGGLRGK